MKKIRLIYLAPSLGLTLNQSGGAGTHMRGTIKGFEQNDVEVLPLIGGDVFPIQKNIKTVITSEARKETLIFNTVKKLMPDRLRLLLRDLRYMRQDKAFENKVAPQIEEFKPDAIYERSGYLSMAGYNLSRRYNIPLFLETDGCMVEIISDDYGVFSKAFGNKIEHKKLAAANYIVVMNSLAISIVAQKFNLKKDNFLVKTLGIDPVDIVPKSVVEKLKTDLGINGKFTVGFVGAISTYHGVNLLIDAARILKHSGVSEVVIVIVGWSKEGEKLKEVVDLEGLNNVVFTGKVDKSKVANYYSMFDVGVIPDAEEGIYPIKVLEYGNFKNCPLIPNYEVFKEVITDERTGYYFDARNAESIAETIIRMNSNTENVLECAVRWNEYVRANFNWKDTVREIVRILNK